MVSYEMDLEYDDASADAASSSAQYMSRIYQSLSKSKTSLVLVNLLVICLVVSVVSLIFTFVFVNDAQNQFEERFARTEAAIIELRYEIQRMKEEKTTSEPDDSDQNLSLSSLQQKLQATVESQENLTQSVEKLSAQVSTDLLLSLNQTQQDLQDTIEAQQQLEESFQSLSDEVSTELSVSIQGTQRDLQSLSNQVTAYHQTTPVVTCPSGYRRNPYSNSCIRQVTTSKSWNDARIYCIRSGERLATFETLESQYWFINLRKTTWTTEHVWIGGDRSSSSGWRWNSDSSKPIDIVVWGTEEPTDDGSENCLESLNTKEYKFNDETCDSTYWFVCER